ncbi:MAG: M23 family metallopeptidase [Bacteroidota bacterium]
MSSTMTGFCQLSDKEIRDLMSGRVKDDTSYVYSLPFTAGKSYLLIQGSNSSFSHKSELAFDFKMKKGSSICAARGGLVIDTRSDSKEGGLKQKNYADGNYIFIKHADGSVAQYWHFEYDGVKVNVGDTVKEKQVIGLSGNTGYSAFPHLHFQVSDSQDKNILVRFRTKKGAKYIRAGSYYRAT